MSESKTKLLTIDLNNKSDRRALMDRLCASVKAEKLPASSELDLIDFCVKHKIEFFGFQNEDNLNYKFRVKIDVINSKPTDEEVISNPDLLAPNTAIGETQADMDKVKSFTPTEEEKRKKKAEEKALQKSEDVTDFDDVFPAD